MIVGGVLKMMELWTFFVCILVGIVAFAALAGVALAGVVVYADSREDRSQKKKE